MVIHKLKIPDELVILIRKMHPLLKKKIRIAFETIIDNPESGKALREELEGLNSYRVGTFRVIYRISEKNIIEIIAIGPRKNIYHETYRIVSREN